MISKIVFHYFLRKSTIRGCFLILQIIVAVLCGLATAKPKYLAPVVSYGYLGVPLAYDGRVLDTPEVARAKVAHLATQAYEAARNTLGYAHVPVLTRVYAPAITYGAGAPIGPDGRVVDTPEVAAAKAAHFAAHALVMAKPFLLGEVP